MLVMEAPTHLRNLKALTMSLLNIATALDLSILLLWILRLSVNRNVM